MKKKIATVVPALINQTPFFSIIIPVYNAEKFLTKTINSILDEDNKRLEIILINDFSKDKSLKICKDFKNKNKNKNIILINNKKNLGPGECRNFGIKKAKGKYLIFLDSDDYIIKDSIKKIQQKIIKNNYPSVLLNNVYKDNKQNNLFLKFFKSKIYSKELFIKKLLKHKISINECWNLIVQNSPSLKKIKFLNIRIAEDNGYVIDIFLNMKKILINKSSHIFHTSRIDSLKHSISFENAFAYLILLLKYINLIKKFKKNSVFLKYFKFKIIETIKFLQSYIYLLNKKDKIRFFSLRIFKNIKNLNFLNLPNASKYSLSINSIQSIKNFKKNFEKQLDKILLIKKQTGYSLNIFCSGLVCKNALKYLHERNIKINKVIDEDPNINGKLVMNYKIYLFSKLKQKKFKNSLNLICHLNKNVQNTFITKLTKLNIDLKNIFVLR